MRTKNSDYNYTGDFCCDFSCDFLLLEDVKEWMSYKCSRLSNLITTSLSNLLLHVFPIALRTGRKCEFPLDVIIDLYN
jgi:hypothetical protein